MTDIYNVLTTKQSDFVALPSISSNDLVISSATCLLTYVNMTPPRSGHWVKSVGQVTSTSGLTYSWKTGPNCSRNLMT